MIVASKGIKEMMFRFLLTGSFAAFRIIRHLLTVILLLGGCLTGYAQSDSILHDSAYRTYLLHVPSSYYPENPVPLIVAMHGG